MAPDGKLMAVSVAPRQRPRVWYAHRSFSDPSLGAGRTGPSALDTMLPTTAGFSINTVLDEASAPITLLSELGPGAAEMTIAPSIRLGSYEVTALTASVGWARCIARATRSSVTGSKRGPGERDALSPGRLPSPMPAICDVKCRGI